MVYIICDKFFLFSHLLSLLFIRTLAGVWEKEKTVALTRMVAKEFDDIFKMNQGK